MISEEQELNSVAREMAEELCLRVNPSKNRICHNCGQIIKNKNWPTHLARHRAHYLGRGIGR